MSEPKLTLYVPFLVQSDRGQNDIPPASSFIISYSTDGGDSNTITVPGPSTSYTLSNPTRNAVYTFTVTAVNDVGESVPYSVVATGKITLTLTVLTRKCAPFEYKPPSLNRKLYCRGIYYLYDIQGGGGLFSIEYGTINYYYTA